MPGIPAIAVPCPPLAKKHQPVTTPPVTTDFISYWLEDQWISQWV